MYTCLGLSLNNPGPILARKRFDEAGRILSSTPPLTFHFLPFFVGFYVPIICDCPPPVVGS
jgi:hypothetical protein